MKFENFVREELEKNEANMSGKDFESTVDGSCEVGLR